MAVRYGDVLTPSKASTVYEKKKRKEKKKGKGKKGGKKIGGEAQRLVEGSFS